MWEVRLNPRFKLETAYKNIERGFEKGAKVKSIIMGKVDFSVSEHF